MDALNTHEIYWRSLKISSLQKVKLTSNGLIPDQEEYISGAKMILRNPINHPISQLSDLDR